MHVLHAFVKLPGVAGETIEERLLPKAPFSAVVGVEVLCGSSFHVMQDPRNSQWVLWPNGGVPMVGHQDISAQQKSQAFAFE